jgi:RNA polymerase sigma-70 factor (ECF subfamily)
MVERTLSKGKSDPTVRDTELILARSAATGDRAAQRRLLLRAMPRVEKSVAYLSGGRSDAEDLAQLALVQIVQSAGSFRGECSLDYWVDRVVLQTLAKQFEKRNRRKRIREETWFAPAEVVSVDDQASITEVRERIQALLAKLKEKHRVPLVLRYVHGYDISEIARLTDLKVNTVRGRLRTGVSKFRRWILLDPDLREWVEQGTR